MFEPFVVMLWHAIAYSARCLCTT